MVRIGGIVLGVAQSEELVVAASSFDASLRAWSRDGALAFEMKTPNNQWALTVAVQGNLAAMGTFGGGLFVVDLQSHTELQHFEGHTDDVMSLVLDGDTILSGSDDKTIRIWDKASGECLQTIHAGAAVNGLATQDDLIVAGLDDKTVRVFDRTSGEELHVLTDATGEINSVAMNAQYMVSGAEDTKLRVYAVPSFELVNVLEGHTELVRSVALQGDYIVSGSFDKTAIVWDAHSGAKLHVLKGHSNMVWSVSLQGSEVVTGSSDNSVRVWDAQSGASKLVLNGTEAVSGALAEAVAAQKRESLPRRLSRRISSALGRR
ncbi:F-box/WD repeat-containing protein 7 [Hondaea fermentalgiana]|uniref:F-box/WD repeat-containing protein 7 n=1 Tax=Hondaea fermentalgiana TaxID=2315210 RepID=A0A2R5G546_9STRA|nr:F-box/WD repeat-containing protein 7 [Hondaea fermentalgiana]|eukprot:GBG24908.1 F-box/WD repeat-containing protein 7 [Hondaea fermentalgiana]